MRAQNAVDDDGILLGAARCLLALAIVVGVATSVGEARSQEAVIEWDAPSECPSRAQLMRAIEALLGEPIGARPGFRASGKVSVLESGNYELDLYVRVSGGRGVRKLTAEDCASLTRVAAFSIALAINPDLETSDADASTEAREPEGEVDAPPAETSTSSSASRKSGGEPSAASAPSVPLPGARTNASEATSPNSESEWTPWLGAQVVVDSGLLPAWGFGAGATLEADVRRWRLRLSGALFLSQDEFINAVAGGHFTLWSGALSGCYQVGRKFWVAPCPVLQLSHLAGEGTGVAVVRRKTALVVAPGLGVLIGADWSRRFATSLNMELVFPTQHDSFEIDSGVVHRVPAAVLRGYLGLHLGFP